MQATFMWYVFIFLSRARMEDVLCLSSSIPTPQNLRQMVSHKPHHGKQEVPVKKDTKSKEKLKPPADSLHSFV